MAAADILDTVTSSMTDNTVIHLIDLPPDVAVGEWVVAAVALQASTVLTQPVTWPAGWAVTELLYDQDTAILGAVLVHECHGLEDWFEDASPQALFRTSSSVISAHVTARCRAGGVYVQAGTLEETDTTPNPPAAQALWLDNEASVALTAIAGFVAQDNATFTISSNPTGYADDQTTVIDDNGTQFVRVGIAADDLTASGNVDPGTFTLSAAVDIHIGFTVLLYPAADYQTFAYPAETLVETSVQVGITSGLMVGYPIRWIEVDHKDVREFSVRRGRQQELDVVEASTASLTLDNNDGTWTPTNTGGAYYPYVNPMMPIRIVALSDGIVYHLFTGYLERLPLATNSREDHILQATAVDALKVFGLQRWGSGRASAVEALEPVAWWRMTDTGTADSSTAGTHTLTWNGTPTTGVPGAWVDDEAIAGDGTGVYATVASEADVELRADMSIEAWFKPAALGSFIAFGCIISCSSLTDTLYDLLWNDSNESLFFGPTNATSSYVEAGAGLVTAGEWHHVVVTIDWSGANRIVSVWLNGQQALADVTYPYQPGVTARAVEVGRTAGGANNYWSGLLSEVVVYNRVLTSGEITGLYAATGEEWEVQLTSERVSGVLESVGWVPQAVRTGQTEMQFTPRASDPRAEFDRAATTEFGQFFINGQGVAVFHDRHYRILEQGTAAGAFTTTDGGGVHYAGLVIGTDDNELWTEVKVTPGTVDNSSSTAANTAVAISDNTTLYGFRTLELTTYPEDRDEGLTMASFLLGRYESPAQHVEAVSFRLGFTQSEVTELLAAELGTRYTVTRSLPGDDFTEDVHLEAVEHRVSTGGWEVGMWLSPATTQSFWVLGDSVLSVLDTTTRLAF